MGAKLWSDADVATLRTLWDKGLSGSQISRALGSRYSGKAVIGKANRLKLTPRPSTMNRHLGGRVWRLGPTIPKPAKPAPVTQLPEEPEFIGPDNGEAPRQGLCQFPRGDALPYHFCGQPATNGPYCAFHHGICRVKATGKPNGAFDQGRVAKVFGGKP